MGGVFATYKYKQRVESKHFSPLEMVRRHTTPCVWNFFHSRTRPFDAHFLRVIWHCFLGYFFFRFSIILGRTCTLRSPFHLAEEYACELMLGGLHEASVVRVCTPTLRGRCSLLLFFCHRKHTRVKHLHAYTWTGVAHFVAHAVYRPTSATMMMPHGPRMTRPYSANKTPRRAFLSIYKKLIYRALTYIHNTYLSKALWPTGDHAPPHRTTHTRSNATAQPRFVAATFINNRTQFNVIKYIVPRAKKKGGGGASRWKAAPPAALLLSSLIGDAGNAFKGCMQQCPASGHSLANPRACRFYLG